MGIVAAVILGVVQGLTEFLPISSSAHLIIFPWLFNWKPQGLIFDVSLHVGTAVAILVYFWRDWITMATHLIRGIAQRNLFEGAERRLAWFLVLGTIPAMIVGLAAGDYIEENLRSPLFSVVPLVLFGVVLYFAEMKSRQERSLGQIDWRDSLWIGMSQALALIPGVSRSGITVSTAMLRDIDRPSAARFSFLLSTPVIVGAGLIESWHLFKAVRHPTAGAVLNNLDSSGGVQWTVLLVGVVTAAVTGFLCIRYFLRYLQNNSLVPFVIYRFALAGLVVLLYFTS